MELIRAEQVSNMAVGKASGQAAIGLFYAASS